MLMFQESRTEVLSQLAKKEAEKKALECELEKYKECDPDVMEQMKTELVIAKDAANRWTDNIFSTKSWIKNRFHIEESALNKQFEIPEDLDYI
ncbi:hypothetical protein LSH36_109g02032 [Paralvinella palmiformis]|uniref:Leucine zipper with capping helix domain-containing protein n=1 Tax=Paralvinella palmiformis TaxID=53620 RepID=A0AAD9JYY6_9ANNE|nr:hypothetical protein LSH36_109g02032 [Paralvinella palmiformis]